MSHIQFHTEDRKNPLELTPHENALYTRVHNKSLRDFVINKFREIDFGKIVRQWFLTNKGLDVGVVEFMVVGSDGREEKGPASPLEGVIMIHSPSGVQMSLDLFDLIALVNHDLGDLDILDPSTEVKNTAGGNLIAYRSKPGVYFPSRVIDGLPVVESGEGLIRKAKMATAQEIVRFQKDIIRKKKDRFSVHQRVTRTGKSRSHGEDIVHFDLDAGKAFLDRGKYVNGFKYGPLRFVQTWVMMQVVGAVSRSSDPEAFILELPSNTADKLNFLHGGKFIDFSSGQVSDLISLYHYFLWLYHQSEHAFKYEDRGEIDFDISEVRSSLDALLRVVGSLSK
ncbi:MAG: hypothetical protein AAB551_02830 [Patescibacteria group bacterium]